MTFHQPYSGYTFDPVFPGSFDERFHNFRFPQDYHRGFYTYPPNLGSISSQNVDLNCYPVPTRNVPYPSFSGESFHQLPYANHAVVPSRFLVDPWANLCSSDTYFPTPPDNCSQFLNRSVHDCCNVQQSFTQPNHVHSSFLQLDDDNPVGCNAGQYQQSSDIGFLSSGYAMSNPSQMQYFQCRASPLQQKQTVNTRTNDCFAMPSNYSIDEIMRTVSVTSPNQRGEDATTFGIQSSPLDENNMQWPSFGPFSPLQLCASEPNFEANTGVDTLPAVTDYNTEGIRVNKSQSVSHQSLVEIPSFPSTGRLLADFAVNDSGSSGYPDYRSSCLIASSVSDTQACHINTVSITAHGFTCQAVPEFPHSVEEPVTLAPAIDTSDRLSMGAEFTFDSETLSQCSTLTEQTFMAESLSAVDSSVGCEMPEKDERFDVSGVEMSLPFSDAITVSTFTTPFGNCSLQTDNSEKCRIISAAHSTQVISSEVSVASKNVASGQQPMPEVMECAESCAVSCESVDTASNSSDDVIVLSPLPVTTEHNSPVFVNPKSDVVTSDCRRMQPTSQPGHANTDRRLHSVLRSSLPKSLPVSSHTVPSTDRDFRNSRDHDVLQSRAKHIIYCNCGVHTTSCQMQLPVSQCAISCIPTTFQQPCAVVTTGSSIKPMFCHPPITVVCDTVRNKPPLCQQSAQTELQRQLYMTPSSLKQNLSIPRTYNLSVESNNRRNVFENSQRKRLQKSLLRSPASCQAVPRHGIAWCNARGCMSAASASQNVSSISSSALPIVSPAVRTYPNHNQCINHRYCSLPVSRRDSYALQLRGMALRKNGTYSVRAASILLQRLKQAKLSDLPSARAARQHLLNQRLSSLSHNGAVIDLTADDDGDEDTLETCERIFARARRHRVKMPSLWRPRQCFVRRSNLADASCCGSKYRSVKKTFAVDRSLPFYRCFVQQLLRNYRFTSSGVPVRVYGLFLPPAPPNVSFARRGARSPAHSCTKELVRKRQPVVLLERLEPSVIKQYGVLAADCRNEEEECVRDTMTVSDSASQKLDSEDSGNKDGLPVSQDCASSNHGQEMVEFDGTARESIPEENMAANLMANGRRSDELISLCRPVSVTLERLDGRKIQEICKELCENEDSKDIQSLKRPGTESSASELSWSVTQIPRANKVPILVIRSLTLTQNASWKKVTEKTDACATRQLRSALKCLRTGSSTGGVQRRRNEAPVSSKFYTSQRRISKKLSRCRKLQFRSCALMSSRSRNYAGHFLRRRISAPVIRPRCQNSSKRDEKQSKSSLKLLAERAKNLKKSYAKLTECSYEPESSVTTVEQNDHLIPSDLTSKNGLLTDSLPCDDNVNRNLPEDYESSDSNTVELSPHSTVEVNSSVDHELHCDAVLNHALSTDFWPCNSVFNEECESSDSSTVILSRCSTTDDLTIAYRSPLSDVFDFGELSADEQERLEGSVEASDIDVKSNGTCMAFDIDKELKATSYVDRDGVISLPYSTAVSSLMQSPSNMVESSAFTNSLSCGLVTSSAVNSEQLQPTPVRLIDSVNDGPERQCAINNSSSEFADKDQWKCEMAPSVPDEIVVENTSTGAEKEFVAQVNIFLRIF